jgi:hypothetical protein
MSEAKRAGQQMQKTVSSAKVMKNPVYRFKPYDKPTTSFGQTWHPGNKSYNYKRPFLGHSRATSKQQCGQEGRTTTTTNPSNPRGNI